MKRQKIQFGLLVFLLGVFTACNDNGNSPSDCADEDFFCQYNSRNFKMGFSTWAYGASTESVKETYRFISENADIYSEHIDAEIPWNAWINDLPLPTAFTNEIAARAARKIPGAQLSVSVSLLNSGRDELASDFDGTLPAYSALNDSHIEEAYFKHLVYIANQLNPDYLIVAIEVNELLKNAPEKWEGFKLLMANIRERIKTEFPSMSISESITLHNFYQPDVDNPASFITELSAYANAMDFVAISFYPFFKGLNSKEDFQTAFDFLHNQISKPIVFAETSHLSEDLSVASFDLFIPGNQAEQKLYLETLLTNAQEHNYPYIIWWAHRDYNALWESFPDAVKDLGKLWISTGIINEDGMTKEAYESWKAAFSVGN